MRCCWHALARAFPYADKIIVNEEGVVVKDTNDNTRTLDEFVRAGVNLGALAAQLQDEGATSFVKSWNDLLNVISSKTAALQQAA